MAEPEAAVGQIVTFESKISDWRRQLKVVAISEDGKPVYEPVVESQEAK